jgi:hypothetical protein
VTRSLIDEKMPKMQEHMRARASEYLARAEKLRPLVDEAKKPQAVTANGASKKCAGINTHTHTHTPSVRATHALADGAER